MAKQVRVGFNPRGMTIPIVNILPAKQLKPIVKASQKYHQILSSVREVGIIEPLIVFPQNGNSGTYLLLDGHVRLQVLKDLGQTHAPCLIATDDEAYTYNKRVSVGWRRRDIGLPSGTGVRAACERSSPQSRPLPLKEWISLAPAGVVDALCGQSQFVPD